MLACWCSAGTSVVFSVRCGDMDVDRNAPLRLLQAVVVVDGEHYWVVARRRLVVLLGISVFCLRERAEACIGLGRRLRWG